MACKVSHRLHRRDRWGPTRRFLPGSRSTQYLPAVAFQGEHLWVAAYVSDPEATRVVIRRLTGARFGEVVVVNSWPVARSTICAPHPPDCRQGQAFIGDYIGLVATRHRVATADVSPTATPHKLNGVLVSSFRTDDDD